MLGVALSPSGARAVFEAHGEVLTAPAEKGDIRNLTNTPGTMERDPSWSPDGKWVAYFSDESGEYQLLLKNPDGMGEAQKDLSWHTRVFLLRAHLVAGQQENCF